MDHDRPKHLAPGDQLGGFVVERFVAWGSASQVFRARSITGERVTVALKVFSSKGITDAERARLLREVRVLAGVHHPNLAELLAHGEDRDRQLLFLATRFITGPTLEEVLAERIGLPPLDDAKRRWLVRRASEVAGALALLHERGLVHRDVKPANILQRLPDEEGDGDGDEGEPTAVLVDFGLVRRTDAATATQGHLSLPYAAPETLHSDVVDPRVDVFGLGVTLHDVLAARDPATRRARQVFGLEPLRELVPEVDADLEAVVAKAVDPDPRWRYAHGAALRDDLLRWLCGAPVVARQWSWSNVRWWAVRHRGALLRQTWRGLGLAVAATLLLLGILQGIGWRRALVDARESWRAGDLAHAKERLAGVPRFLHDRPDADAAALLTDATVRDVLLEASVGGAAAGVRAAVGGLAAGVPRTGRELIRYTACTLRQLSARPELPVLVEALRPIARWCHAFPAADPETLDDAAPLRAELEQLLVDGNHGAASRLAVSALGGCGDVDSMTALCAWWRSRLAADSDEFVEESRLALVSLARMVARATACGKGPELVAERGLARRLEEVAPLIEAAAGRVAEEDATIRDASVLWLRSALFLWRRMNVVRDDRRIPACIGADSRTVAAAAEDPRVAVQALATLDAITGPDAWPGYPVFEELGWLAGALDAPAATERLLAAVDATAARCDQDGRWSRELFLRGLDAANRERAGVLDDPSGVPRRSAASFARSFVSRSDRLLAAVEVGDPESSAVSWSFLDEPVRIRGAGGAIELTDAWLERDEYSLVASRFLFLAFPGRSSATLRYTLPGGALRLPVLSCQFQKSGCAYLPGTGEASLVVEHDGEVQMTIGCTVGGVCGMKEIVLTAVDDARPREHLLRLSVSRESTVGLRVFDVQIRFVRPTR